MKLSSKKLLLFYGLIALVLLGFFSFRNEVSDWVYLRSYEPSQEILDVKESINLTDEGRDILFLSDPLLVDKSRFGDYCSENDSKIILGCYDSDDRIFVLDVADTRVKFVEEITTAHEILHAVYDNFSNSEKERIDGLIKSQQNQFVSDQVRESLEAYADKSESVRMNELHSIIGVEQYDLIPELTSHYDKYFLDRKELVNMSMTHRETFSELEMSVDALDNNLESQKIIIDSTTKQVEDLSVSLRSDLVNLNRLREGSPEIYNSLVPTYNNDVLIFNNLISELDSLVEKYNLDVITRNNIADDYQDLLQTIDSKYRPINDTVL